MEKYRDVVASSPDAIFIVDRKSGKIVDVNDAVCSLLGYSRDELVGTVAGSRVVPSQKDAFRREFAKHKKLGKFAGEFELRRKDGSSVTVDVRGTAFGDYLLAVARDITERRRLEEALRASEEKYRRLVIQNKDAIFIGRIDGSVAYASPACLTIFGFTPEEFMSDPMIAAKIVHPDYRKKFNEFWENYARAKKFPEKPSEWAWIRKDDKVVYTENTFTNIHNEKGEVVEFQTVARDITERKQLEARLKAQYKGIPIPTYTWQKVGEDFILVDYNDAAVSITRGGVANYLGTTAKEMYPQQRDIQDDLLRCLNEKSTIKREMPYRYLSTGEEKYLAVTYGFVPPDLVIVHTEDITEREKAEKELTTLLDIGQNISSTLELDKLLDMATKKTVEATGVDRVSVVLLDEEGRGRVPAAYTKDGEKTGVGNVFDLSDFQRMKAAVEKKRAIYVPDALDPRTQSPIEIALAKKLNIGSGVHVPLLVRDKVVGLLNLAVLGKTRAFKKRELEFYKAIANQLSAMIANAELYGEAKKAKDRAEASEHRLRTIIETEPEGVAIIGLDGTVQEINSAGIAMIEAERPEQIIGKSIYELVTPEYRERARALFESVLRGNNAAYEAEISGFKGGRRWIETRAVPLRDEKHEITAMLAISRDITERKRAETEMKRRMMKFKLDEGRLYLVKEHALTLSLLAFKDLLSVGYKGVVVSRTPEGEFRKAAEGVFEYLWIAERGGVKATPPELTEIELRLENVPRGCAILIDRLDYLAFKKGFEKTLAFVQRLRESAYLAGHVVILSIDPSTLSEKELRLLEKEALEIEPLRKAMLPEDLLEVLRYVYRQNTIGIKPSYTEAGLELGISKPTARKRIRNLVSAGYAMEAVKGRSKVLELTWKGRSVFAE